jgi:hypothetical protein
MNILRLFCVSVALVAAAAPPLARATEQAVSLAPSQALDALQQLLTAYSAGNPKQLEALVEPQMIGYSRVVDAVRDAGLAQKQLRLTLSDTRTQISEDVVIVQTQWEKRYLSPSGRAMKNTTGHCTFVMRPVEASGWKLSALSGDNPFGAD